jgi:hypothetical protein
MGAAKWRTLGTVDLVALATARVEMINLAQWPARIANSYLKDGTPERRTDLEFHPVDAAFVTKQFATGVSLEMRLPNLEMQFLDNGRPVPHVFDPEEHSPAEVEAWILVELLHRGIDRENFLKALPYTIPHLRSGDAKDHSPQSCQKGLTQLMTLYQDAASVLNAAACVAGTEKIRIVCLPQTLELTCVSGLAAKQSDFGFSPGDAENPEPYFYANIGSTNGPVAGTKRSILAASTLSAEKDPAAAAMTFIRS